MRARTASSGAKAGLAQGLVGIETGFHLHQLQGRPLLQPDGPRRLHLHGRLLHPPPEPAGWRSLPCPDPPSRSPPREASSFLPSQTSFPLTGPALMSSARPSGMRSRGPPLRRQSGLARPRPGSADAVAGAHGTGPPRVFVWITATVTASMAIGSSSSSSSGFLRARPGPYSIDGVV